MDYRLFYDCPLCDHEHEVKVITKLTQGLVKDEVIEYEATYYLCEKTGEEFAPSAIINRNLLNSIDSYRKKHDLLTSEEIKRIRDKYSLTQKELANLLGWGDVTIQRYEKKAIQDETYDSILRRIDVEPLFALDQIKLHKSNFDLDRYIFIVNIIKSEIKKTDNFFYKYREIENSYVDFESECDENGYKKLDLSKVERVIAYLTQYVKPLYKVKLMKLLWYIDVLHYKLYSRSMTGLVYKHLPLGAVPIAYEEILKLPEVEIVEEYLGEHIGYRISSKLTPTLSDFTFDEIEIINKVINFFKGKNTNEIVNYMHEETAYLSTGDNDIIPYNLGAKIRDFN